MQTSTHHSENNSQKAMNVLIIGTGGREHALAWKILQSPRLEHLYLTSQNAGVYHLKARYPRQISAPVLVSEADQDGIINFVKNYNGKQQQHFFRDIFINYIILFS